MEYNSMWDVAFTVVTGHEDYTEITAKTLLAGLRRRLEYLEAHPEDCAEAFGFSDQYEIEDDGHTTDESVYAKETERVGGGDTGLFVGIIPGNREAI
jgi:hypothetical protein